ncbi:hypothetical protein SY212_04170 [Ligilactobacillus agilis]|uniref:Uncharacterized protein n=1 Tax=Ligilactobacillus agilis TaxID=1601 RepID=A0A6F9XJK0_9LACO|nr:hypothetical protein [Ligilactobacillus agilis]GET05387.1 hypothetical protein SY212_04170 [Ligilactobacillus agilis]
MKFYLTQPVYEVTIRDFGGGWFSGNCIKGYDLDKVREAGLKNYMESTAHEGGYFYITKVQYINGDKLCRVEEMLDFTGNEEEFLLNNKETIEERKAGMVSGNRISWSIAFDKYGKGKTKKELARQYLMHNLVIDKELLDDIQKQPAASINLVGGVANWYCASASDYHDIKSAISVVDYKYPNSERVWLRIIKVWQQVAKEKLATMLV